MSNIRLFLLFAAFCAGCVRLFRTALGNSEDFAVYWKAVRTWLAGQNPYAYGPENMGFVFKYPPWLLAPFAPIGWMGFESAKLFWAFVQLVCILYAVYWLIEQGVERRFAIVTLLLFWWIWLAHFAAGQVTLLMMALGLFCFSRNAFASLAFVYSAKIFSVISLVGLRGRIKNWAKPATYLVTAILVSHLVLWIFLRNMTLFELYRAWVRAAASGGSELGEIIVRGQGNHGFTAGILRWLPISATGVKWDISVFVVLSIFFGWLWTRASRFLTPAQSWTGWLALGVIVHPLAWHHSFVMAFPLCAFALNEAMSSRRPDKKINIALALLGTCCIGILIPQVIGKTLVRPIELVSVKSWGVCLAGLALYRARWKSEVA